MAFGFLVDCRSKKDNHRSSNHRMFDVRVGGLHFSTWPWTLTIGLHFFWVFTSVQLFGVVQSIVYWKWVASHILKHLLSLLLTHHSNAFAGTQKNTSFIKGQENKIFFVSKTDGKIRKAMVHDWNWQILDPCQWGPIFRTLDLTRYIWQAGSLISTKFWSARIFLSHNTKGS